jgi:predicted DCC family thiol-disulfide oxidoreductase YuxK
MVPGQAGGEERRRLRRLRGKPRRQREWDPVRPESRHGCILYDDSCGFCRRWVPFFGPILHRYGFAFEPLQSAWVARAIPLAADELVHDIRLLRTDGEHVEGAEVYREVMRRIWWAWPLWAISVAPGLSRIFDLGYSTFARNRHRFSKACGMGDGSEGKQGPRG